MIRQPALSPVFAVPPGFRARRNKRRWGKLGRLISAIFLIGVGCGVAAMTNELGWDLLCGVAGGPCEIASDWSVTETVRPVFPVAAKPGEKLAFMDI